MAAERARKAEAPPARLIVPALGVTQILAWGSSYYLPAVLAQPIANDTGWPLTWVVGGLSLGLLVAGLASPLVGRLIHRHGGRPVLIASAVLLATGALGLAVAPTLPVFIAAWMVMGLGMSAGLYDAAFSTLGRIYGQGARQHITTLTLFGGLASTVCWPLSAFLVQELGWRGTCAAYAAIQALLSLTIYLVALPREPRNGQEHLDGATPAAGDIMVRPPWVFLLLATTITIAPVLSTIMSVHLLTILQARDISLAAAVALGAMVGPSQVGARFIEMLIAKYHHPIWTKIASVTCVTIGLGLLWVHFPLVALALIFCGAGIGLESIARATLPLVLYGVANYAPIMGKLARPSLIAQAAAPSIGAFLIQWFGSDRALGVIATVAGINVVLALVLLVAQRKTEPPAATGPRR
ncbi:MAG TPA: MFS transporter [Dongiaceae bacterium]|jgi:predicted MFS family arabinose efflux permease